LRYERVYLKAYDTVSAPTSLTIWTGTTRIALTAAYSGSRRMKNAAELPTMKLAA
jgi:hypothetical protein